MAQQEENKNPQANRKQQKFQWKSWLSMAALSAGFISLSAMLLYYMCQKLISPYDWLLCIALGSLIIWAIMRLIQFTIWAKYGGNFFRDLKEKVEALEKDKTVDHRQFLLERVKLSARDFSDLSWRMFRQVRYYKYAMVGCSSLITILLGLSVADTGLKVPINNVALIISTIVTALGTMMTYWNIEEYWIQNKLIKHQLDMLSTKIIFTERNNVLKPEEKQTKFDAFFDDYINILRSFYVYWEGAQQQIGK